MVKEIFEIEPIQKNTLIVFLGLFSLVFLQIFLFKKEIFDNGILIILLFTLGMTVSWTVLSLPSLIMFVVMIEYKDGELRKDKSLILENVVLICGILMICWILTLTYLAYEFEYNFKKLIRIGIYVTMTRFLLWTLIYFVRTIKIYNNEKELRKKVHQ